ncbi:MAG: hypothetical protein OIF32_04005 [Campylobacterales bacterium]|nr:hypothetical protein [Campylobacterales bacterium]
MKLEKNGSTLNVFGLVDTVKVADEIAHELGAMVKTYDKQPIVIDFKETFVITSSLIGALLGATQRDNANLTLKVKHQELYDLLDKLNLLEALKVKKY